MNVFNKLAMVALALLVATSCSDTDFQASGTPGHHAINRSGHDARGNDPLAPGGHGAGFGDGSGGSGGFGNGNDHFGTGLGNGQGGFDSGLGGNGSGAGNGSLSTDDASIIAGVPVTKVGISFEDGSDNDYNDISVCFQGDFKLEGGRKAVMAHPGGQNVNLRIKRITGASVRSVLIRIVDDVTNATIYENDFQSSLQNLGNQIEHNVFFPFNSRLYVRYQWSKGSADTDGTNRVRIEQDTCRDFGR